MDCFEVCLVSSFATYWTCWFESTNLRKMKWKRKYFWVDIRHIADRLDVKCSVYCCFWAFWVRSKCSSFEFEYRSCAKNKDLNLIQSEENCVYLASELISKLILRFCSFIFMIYLKNIIKKLNNMNIFIALNIRI